MEQIAKYRAILALAQWQQSTPPSAVAAWLGYQGSLTEKMRIRCPQLQVKVIKEGWNAEKTENASACWRREVILHCNGTGWIFGQTDLAAETIAQVAQQVPNLGQTPLGEWLFPQQPQRQTLEWTYNAEHHLYARRSMLTLQGFPLEIRELFLPAFRFAD